MLLERDLKSSFSLRLTSRLLAEGVPLTIRCSWFVVVVIDCSIKFKIKIRSPRDYAQLPRSCADLGINYVWERKSQVFSLNVSIDRQLEEGLSTTYIEILVGTVE